MVPNLETVELRLVKVQIEVKLTSNVQGTETSGCKFLSENQTRRFPDPLGKGHPKN